MFVSLFVAYKSAVSSDQWFTMSRFPFPSECEVSPDTEASLRTGVDLQIRSI